MGYEASDWNYAESEGVSTINICKKICINTTEI